MRRAFTLIEILVIVAIMATMVSVSVIGVRAGQDAARVKGATRDIMASIRHARSLALVMMQPAVITYSTTHIDDEICAQVTVDGVRLLADNSSETVQTLSGETINRDGTPVDQGGAASRRAALSGDDDKDLMGDEGGETMEDILFSPMATDVVKGVRLKVTMGDELIETEETPVKRKSGVSVFSNVDYLLGRYKDAKKSEEERKKKDEDVASESASFDDPDQEPVSLVWEANGRCDPHRVWVYKDGSAPESGLCIKVDRFGAAKVLSGEEAE